MKSLIIFVFAGFCALFLGCNDNSNNSSSTQTSNDAPIIHSLSSNPVNVGRQEYTDLTCVATDSDGDSLTYFWQATSGSISGNDATVRWRAPNIDGHYWVAVTVSDSREVDKDSLELTVYPPNAPPSTPFDPRPGNGERDVTAASVNFSWRCIDADGDSITYDFYFGGYPSGSLIQRDLDGESFQVEELNANTTYYWGVRARDDRGAESSRTVWEFCTQ